VGVSEAESKIISEIPVVGLLPIDEAFDYAAFLADELLQEYEATVDENLIQTVICDLFCIAVSSNCHLDFNDVYTYFADKCSATLSNVLTTFTQLVQFGLTGTFSGDDYFYYMCYLQLATVGMGQFFLSLNSVEPYGMKAREGQLSPSSNWSIYCINCPVYTHWELTWDFAWGVGEFTLVAPTTLVGNHARSYDNGPNQVFIVSMDFDVAYNIENMAAWVQGDSHIGNGTWDYERYSSWTGLGNTGAENICYQQGFIASNALTKYCADNIVTDNNSLSVRWLGSMSDIPANTGLNCYKVRLVGADNGNGKPALARWKTSEPLCADFL